MVEGGERGAPDAAEVGDAADRRCGCDSVMVWM